MAGIDKQKLERYRKGKLKFMQIFGLSGAQMASVLECGHNFFSEGRLEEARKIFEGLAVLDPNHPYIHTMLGAVYQRMEQYDTALIRYTLALKLYPHDIYALTNRAEIYLMLGKFPEAAADLKQVLELDSQKKNPAASRARMLSVMAAESLHKVRQQRSTSN
ncbi:tetratricopeptide repeat protein [bacterium]|nr:tetratricopeptide repeat protein [bacterium]MCI0603770.1 tetratricopeptide repeat protein [bacterium]